jgi:histone-lysine N-methyltransferase SETMAR
LPEVIAEIRRNNLNRRIIVHHDNANAHTAKRTVEFLISNNIEIMTHCRYSPDLSSNDFFLFAHIKNTMRGERFSSSEGAVEAFKLLVSKVPRSECKKSFEDWFHRMQKCIEVKGEYFEKQ